MHAPLVEHGVSSLLGAALDDDMLPLQMGGIEKVLGGFTNIKMVRSVYIR